MAARSPDQRHRSSTRLELLFDLCFVVAVAQAGSALEDQMEQGRVGHGIVGYLLIFFAVWWAWMNFSWFASAYDTDDAPYRLTVLVQIAGSLVLAAGAARGVNDGDFTVVTWGYAIMRLAVVTNWLRAARSDPPRRATALRYAFGIIVLQLLWLIRLGFPQQVQLPVFVVLALGELLVPYVAERVVATTFHPEHISDRYGDFTVIVLGEAVTAAVIAVRTAIDAHAGASLLVLAGLGLLILFSLWWVYFDQPLHQGLSTLTGSLYWGYLHFFVFSGMAAVGAGISLEVAYQTHTEETGDALTATVVAAMITVPVSVCLVALWLLHLRSGDEERLMRSATPAAVALILLSTATRFAMPVTAVVLVLLVVIMLIQTRGPVRRRNDAERARQDSNLRPAD